MLEKHFLPKLVFWSYPNLIGGVANESVIHHNPKSKAKWEIEKLIWKCDLHLILNKCDFCFYWCAWKPQYTHRKAYSSIGHIHTWSDAHGLKKQWSSKQKLYESHMVWHMRYTHHIYHLKPFKYTVIVIFQIIIFCWKWFMH